MRLPGGLTGSYRRAATEVHATRVAEWAEAIRGSDALVLEVAAERAADAMAACDRIPAEPVEVLATTAPWGVQMDILATMLNGLEQQTGQALDQWQVFEARAGVTAMRCVLDAQDILERLDDVPEGADFMLTFEVARLTGIALDGIEFGRHDVAVTALDSLTAALPALRERLVADSRRRGLRAVAA